MGNSNVPNGAKRENYNKAKIHPCDKEEDLTNKLEKFGEGYEIGLQCGVVNIINSKELDLKPGIGYNFTKNKGTYYKNNKTEGREI